MQVFKLYFKLLKHYKGIVIMYFSIFLTIALVMTGNLSAGNRKELEEEKLDIVIIDQDRKTLGPALKGYFGEVHHLAEMEYDEIAILNELYWRRIDYVLVIPAGFEDSLSENSQQGMELECMKVPGIFDASYFEAEMNLYTSKLEGLLAAGYSIEEAEAELMKLRTEKTTVSFASFVNENQNDAGTIFFVYAPYLFIALGMNGVGIVLIHFNEKEVKDRMECGAVSMKKRVAGITAGILAFGMILLAVVLVVAGIISKGGIYMDIRFPFFLLNLTAMLLLGLSLGFFTGMVAGNTDAVNGMVNIVSIGLCFIGGVFVPQEFFSDKILKVAKFFPTYWYVVNNETIGGMKKLTSKLSGEIFSQVGLVACYALVIFSVTLVIISTKRKRTAH